ncbi:MAG: metallopeptidase family protein [Actinomycetota bacterium]
MRRRRGSSWADKVGGQVAARQRFEAMVQDALDELPAMFQEQLDNLAIVISDTGDPGMLGLYEGIPSTLRDGSYSGVLPDVITIYRRPLEMRAKDEASLAREVRITVLHEIAHHLGIDDERLHELGWD